MTAKRKRPAPKGTGRLHSVATAVPIVDVTSGWTEAEAFNAADRALESGRTVILAAPGVVVVPDVAVVEGMANGLPPLPMATRLVRRDGRTVYVYRFAKRAVTS